VRLVICSEKVRELFSTTPKSCALEVNTNWGNFEPEVKGQVSRVVGEFQTT